METPRTIGSFFLLSVYFLVLLHSIIPHCHIDGDHDIVSELTYSEHHHHDHDHEKNQPASDHPSDTDGDLFHSLGHLLHGFNHVAAGEDHLVHITTDNTFPQPKLKVVFPVLVSYVLPPVDIHEGKLIPQYTEPYYEQLLSSALPLRAPPAFS